MLKLYDMERSGNCYKARLMLALLGLPYEKVLVDLSKGQQKEPGYLALNPVGQVPTLDDNGTVIRDSSAVLVYLGAKYGKGSWYPATPEAMGAVQQWLAYVTNEVFQGLAISRAIKIGIRQGDYEAAKANGLKVLGLYEAALSGKTWLVGNGPTVADVASYSYIAMSPQAGISHDAYPAIAAWCGRIEALPGYVAPPNPPKA